MDLKLTQEEARRMILLTARVDSLKTDLKATNRRIEKRVLIEEIDAVKELIASIAIDAAHRMITAAKSC